MMPVRTSTVCRPASMPATMSVSMRSPIIAVFSECAPILLSAERNIMGFGLPTTYGSLPVAFLLSAAIAPVAGSGPSAEGPVAPGAVGRGICNNDRGRVAVEGDRLLNPPEGVFAGLAAHPEGGVPLGHHEAR